ncbi:hypothetical protein CEXT_178511 [Caerostris extrusa]|uniref:Uncharacterized protein n=1 Tax=Caerostris extrusa TaxID=172846 RepID=A0AAV4Q3T1_CAEEX|nr:hypothetical protein CEXT_178511 [Caerostris extrusa]
MGLESIIGLRSSSLQVQWQKLALSKQLNQTSRKNRTNKWKRNPVASGRTGKTRLYFRQPRDGHQWVKLSENEGHAYRVI